MSAYVRSLVYSLDLEDPAVVHEKPSNWGVAAIPFPTLEAEEQAIEPNPVLNSPEPHPCDAAHPLVRGDKSQKARRDRISRAAPLCFVVP